MDVADLYKIMQQWRVEENRERSERQRQSDSEKNEMKTEMALLKNKVETHLEEQTTIRLAVFGNGEKGLDEQVRELKNFQSTHSRLVWALVTSLISAGAYWVFTV